MGNITFHTFKQLQAANTGVMISIYWTPVEEQHTHTHTHTYNS